MTNTIAKPTERMRSGGTSTQRMGPNFQKRGYLQKQQIPHQSLYTKWMVLLSCWGTPLQGPGSTCFCVGKPLHMETPPFPIHPLCHKGKKKKGCGGGNDKHNSKTNRKNEVRWHKHTENGAKFPKTRVPPKTTNSSSKFIYKMDGFALLLGYPLTRPWLHLLLCG